MDQKSVLVTGVTRGIGNAICKKLIGEGYKVYGTFSSSKESANHLKEEFGEKIELLQADFTDREQTLDLINKLNGTKFYGIVNNAGIIIFEDFENLTLEAWDKTINVNLTTPLIITHGLRNSILDGGAVVNIASNDGMVGSYTSIAYSATKAALINLTKSLANVFGKRKVRVNAVAPGWVGTGMDSPAIGDAKYLTPLNRTADYEEIADVVSYLLSDKSSFIDGTTIIVDGGMSGVDYVLKKESETLD